MPPPGGGWDAFILFWTAVVAAELAYPHIFVEDSEAVKIFRLADFAACVFFSYRRCVEVFVGGR